jgi:hypothetical protein
LRIDDRAEGVAERNELRRRSPAARWSNGVLRERRYQIGLLQEPQVVGDGLERATILELALQLLQGDDLRRRGCCDGEHLPE